MINPQRPMAPHWMPETPYTAGAGDEAAKKGPQARRSPLDLEAFFTASAHGRTGLDEPQDQGQRMEADPIVPVDSASVVEGMLIEPRGGGGCVEGI